MPLVKRAHECGAEGCEEMTYYYKHLFISYQEKIVVGARTVKAKKALLYLCPVHYEAPNGTYAIAVEDWVLDDL